MMCLDWLRAKVTCCKGLGLDEKYVHELEFESMFILDAVGNQP